MPRHVVLPDSLPVEELEGHYRTAHDPIAHSIGTSSGCAPAATPTTSVSQGITRIPH